MSGGWGYQGLRPDTAIPAYQYGAYVDVPLFTGGRLEAEIATRDIEVKKLTEIERQVRDEIGFEVRTAATRLESARTEVEAANLGVSLAREGVTQAQDRFRAGVANNIEVITAQNELARANDNQIAALYRYNQSRADLARATGQMESLYAKIGRRTPWTPYDRSTLEDRRVTARAGDTRERRSRRPRSAHAPRAARGTLALAGFGTLAAAAAAASAFIHYQGRVSTDDAQVDAPYRAHCAEDRRQRRRRSWWTTTSR